MLNPKRQEGEIMINYEKAKTLLSQGKAEKHDTFNDTGIIYFLCTDTKNHRKLCAFAYPDKKYLDIADNNTLVWYGEISDDLTQVTGSRHNKIATIEQENKN